MKIIEEIKKSQRNIFLDVFKAVSICMRMTKMRCKTKPPEEPDYIAVLAVYFGRRLAKILKRHTNGLTITVDSIFCHQTPKVTTSYGTTEIGDILFVLYNKQKNGSVVLNSLLLQAKVGNHTIPSTDAQLMLYKEWPIFSYDSPKSLADRITLENPACKGKRDALPKTLNIGAKYMLIGTSIHDMDTAVADEHLINDMPLAAEIVKFLTFSSGKTFENDNTGTSSDDWTNIIWDLIKQASISKFKRTNSGFKNQSRRNTQDINTLQNSSTGSTFFFNSENNYNGEWSEAEEGISVIAIEIREETDYARE